MNASGYSVTPTAQWGWSFPATSVTPIVTSYVNGGSTKTGLTYTDLQNFIGLPLKWGGPNGTPIPQDAIVQFLRWAEDTVETDTGILLCLSWVASPPETTNAQANAAQLPGNTGGQRLGVDYDIADVGYDFFFRRFLEEGWGYMVTRFKPLRLIGPSDLNFTAIKNMAYIYPLLNEYFAIPPTWVVEDEDFGFIRIVPATNIQMLPLFAIQIAVMGFAQNLPGAIHIQYMAGLSPADYSAKWSFMKQYVLAQTAIQLLKSMQLSINWGATELRVDVDGLLQETKYNPKGAFAGPIDAFTSMRDELRTRAQNLVAGLVVEGL